MPVISICWPVYELTSTKYSVPRGTFVFFESRKDQADAFLTCLPPQQGKFGPVEESHLRPTGKTLNIGYPVLEDELGFVQPTDAERQRLLDLATFFDTRGDDLAAALLRKMAGETR